MVTALSEQLLAFASELVQIKSRTGQECDVVNHIAAKMRSLNYDQVIIDQTGNVIGVIGNGPERLLYDSHIDNVAVNDPEQWSVAPYGGVIKDGKLYDRGASDMKASATASVALDFEKQVLKIGHGDHSFRYLDKRKSPRKPAGTLKRINKWPNK